MFFLMAYKNTSILRSDHFLKLRMSAREENMSVFRFSIIHNIRECDIILIYLKDCQIAEVPSCFSRENIVLSTTVPSIIHKSFHEVFP